MKIIYAFFIFFICACTKVKNEKSTYLAKRKQGLITQKVMAVTAHPIASKIARIVMKRGGNAFDAAIAVQFALAVVYPQAAGLGGGGFAVFRQQDGQIGSLDFREKAPYQARFDMFQDKKGKVIKGLSLLGGLSIGVPGIVEGMIKLHRRFGTVSFPLLIQPAIDLAEKGHTISKKMAKTLNKYQDKFKQNATYQHIFIKETSWKKDDIIKQPDLANTLRNIRDSGRAGFYSGPVARKLIDTVAIHKGIILHNDLFNYSAKWRNTINFQYRGYKISSMAPPSSGGICIAQIMKTIESYDLKNLGFQSSKAIQLLTESSRRSFADRAFFLGDPDFVVIPTHKLISKDYLDKRMRNFSFQKATKSKDLTYGEISKNAYKESMETTHYSILDSNGNAISITTTLNSNFGSKIYVKDAGFFLNNEMDDFSKKTNTPNQFGLIGQKANEIKSNKRMLSSMSPTIITKNNKLFMILGSPGGPTIITSIIQTISNVIDYSMTMQQAVDAPRFHHQYLPDIIYHEPKAISQNVQQILKKNGYKLKSFGKKVGHVNAILITPNYIEAGADYRGDNTADGY